jgi:predicted N-acyltransferase
VTDDFNALADEIIQRYADDSRLLIIKDLGLDSPLLDAAGNAASGAFLAALQQRGFVVLEGMPLAWLAIDFDSLDGYLARLSPSRRKDIRRKLKSREQLRIECVDTGSELFSDIEQVRRCYALYLQVHAQSLVHFDLLSEAFFAALLRDSAASGKMFLYYDGDELIGWNLCYVHGGKLIDKYVGFSYPRARERNLYVVSWMYNLQYALDHGLSHYVAGWTDSRIKRQLGASFSLTRHAVRARNPLLRLLLRRCAHWFEGEVDDGG